MVRRKEPATAAAARTVREKPIPRPIVVHLLTKRARVLEYVSRAFSLLAEGDEDTASEICSKKDF